MTKILTCLITSLRQTVKYFTLDERNIPHLLGFVFALYGRESDLSNDIFTSHFELYLSTRSSGSFDFPIISLHKTMYFQTTDDTYWLKCNGKSEFSSGNFASRQLMTKIFGLFFPT